jgi:hypothetical protein
MKAERGMKEILGPPYILDHPLVECPQNFSLKEHCFPKVLKSKKKAKILAFFMGYECFLDFNVSANNLSL